MRSAEHAGIRCGGTRNEQVVGSIPTGGSGRERNWNESNSWVGLSGGLTASASDAPVSLPSVATTEAIRGSRNRTEPDRSRSTPTQSESASIRALAGAGPAVTPMGLCLPGCCRRRASRSGSSTSGSLPVTRSPRKATSSWKNWLLAIIMFWSWPRPASTVWFKLPGRTALDALAVLPVGPRRSSSTSRAEHLAAIGLAPAEGSWASWHLAEGETQGRKGAVPVVGFGRVRAQSP